MRKEELKKHKLFARRMFITSMAKLALLTGVAGRYFWLQVINSSKYDRLSDRNRLRSMVLAPFRGRILDRNKLIIAENSSYFKIGVDLSNIDDTFYEQLRELSHHMKFDLDDVKHAIANKRKSIAKGEFYVVKSHLPWPSVVNFLELNHLFKNLELFISFHREYLYPEAFCHITGYISLPNKTEFEEIGLPESGEIKIGKSGIEKIYNKQLSGRIGFRRNEFDARGNFIRTISDINPVPGDPITLSIDCNLQQFVHNLLEARSGSASVVVLGAKTGKVLALHSYPTFDPNKFVDGVSKEYWQTLTSSSKYYPLLNHAISSPYPPGSTFKPITALAALEEGISPETTVHCTGEYRIGSRIFRCWNHSGHGTLNMRHAIAQSCNPYFFHISQRIGINKIAKVARSLGFGEKTGIELTAEVNGLMPDSKWKKGRYKIDWYPGDTLNASIGQGYVLATPLQIARATLGLACGINVSPSLTLEPGEFEQLPFKEENLQVIRDGMYHCVNSPHGILFRQAFSIGDMIICGKTGTSQVVARDNKKGLKEHQEHALFTSFAPFSNPSYVVTIVVEHGEAGARAAAPIAKAIYHYLVNNPIS